jgi:hypothetical protein
VSRLKISLIVGAVLSIALALSAEVAFEAGVSRVARVLLWQSALLQTLVPTPNLGTAALPVYEGTPLHLLAWYVGAILGFPIYSAITYAVLFARRRAGVP